MKREIKLFAKFNEVEKRVKSKNVFMLKCLHVKIHSITALNCLRKYM